MKRSGKPTLILPAEVQVREWDAKMLLAALAAERGFQVVIGCKTRLKQHLEKWPRCYYLAKGVTRFSTRFYRVLNLQGHVVLAFDEEALVYMRPEFYLRRRVGEATIAETTALFAWGEDNAELWRRVGAARQRPVHVTGNPRADLLRPELAAYFRDRVRRLEERYGDFILFNSSFGQVNHFVPEITLPRREEAPAAPEDAVGTNADPRLARHRHLLFERFKEALPHVAAAFPDHTLIVRPHPSGDAAAWRRAVGGADNVVVTGEGNVHEWLRAAKAVFHNGCTSAVEAFLLGRPAIAYQPLRHELYDIPLPNALSRSVSSVDELIEALGRILAGAASCPDASQLALARRHVAAMEGRLAAERMLDEIESLENRGVLASRRPSLARHVRGRLHGWIRRAKKRLDQVREPQFQDPDYLRHRFPDLDTADGERRLACFGAALGRFSRLRIRPYAENVFIVDEP